MATSRTLPAALPRELMLVESAARQLAEAVSLGEIVKIRNVGKAADLCTKLSGCGIDARNAALELIVRAERRAGELLREMDKNKGTVTVGGKSSGGNSVLPPDDTPRLSDLGITKSQSSRWQKSASVPRRIFEEHIESVKAARKELTLIGVVRLAPKNGAVINVESNGHATTEPTEYTLQDALEKINVAVRAVFARWPKDCIETAGHKLVSMGKEILETGGLRE